MFTGIIQEIGTVETCVSSGQGMRLSITSAPIAKELCVNDSVSVNGVCQTVIARTDQSFTVEAVEETLKKTTFGSLKQGSRVNLELPLRVGDRLGGHMVLGHVDTTGKILSIEDRSNSKYIGIEVPAGQDRYIVPVGSVAVDGISLTVAHKSGQAFYVSIIPHTMTRTTIDEATIGSRVNLEFDILGKYVESLLKGRANEAGGVTREDLEQWGIKP